MRRPRPSLAAALADLRAELLAPIETALDRLLRGSGRLADVRRWLRAGPHGHGELLLSWARLSIDTDGLRRELDATRQRADAAEHRADTQRTHGHERELELRAIIDDLAVRILGATLEIGKVAHVEIKPLTVAIGAPDHHRDAYAAGDVHRLLETARHALDVADDTARYASARRRGAARYLRTHGRDATIRANSYAGTLRRIATILDGLSARDRPQDLLAAIYHAADLATTVLDDEEPTP